MKRTGQTLTLSGQLPELPAGKDILFAPQPILEYGNVLDINRAWKVVSYRVWLSERDGAQLGLTDEAMLTLYTQLNTDTIQPSIHLGNNAEINRAIAWSNTLYNCTVPSYKTGSYSNSGVGIVNQAYFIKPEHIVQNNLILATQLQGGGSSENATYKLNYIVYLEEYEISSAESIIFNVKSKGQDLSS